MMFDCSIENVSALSIYTAWYLGYAGAFMFIVALPDSIAIGVTSFGCASSK